MLVSRFLGLCVHLVCLLSVDEIISSAHLKLVSSAFKCDVFALVLFRSFVFMPAVFPIQFCFQFPVSFVSFLLSSGLSLLHFTGLLIGLSVKRWHWASFVLARCFTVQYDGVIGLRWLVIQRWVAPCFSLSNGSGGYLWLLTSEFCFGLHCLR